MLDERVVPIYRGGFFCLKRLPFKSLWYLPKNKSTIMKYLLYSIVLMMAVSCGDSGRTDSEVKEGGDMAKDDGVNQMEDMATEEKAEAAEGDADEGGDDKPLKTWKRSEKGINEATLMIGDEEFLMPKGAKMALKVDGFRARVLIDYMFYSDYDYMLEGTFKMKLPQGASPYYFAFGESVKVSKDSVILENEITKKPFDGDMELSIESIEERMSEEWTEPKIARVVEKEKATLAYGNTVRRRIDPALAEWAGADVFNFRVYPLNPKTMHRVVIGYDVDLTEIGNDQLLKFNVPLVDGPMVLDAEVANIPGIRTILPSGVNARTTNGKQQFRVLNKQMSELNIRYRALKNVSLQSQADDLREAYFVSKISPNIPKTASQNTSENAIVMLDLSLSSRPDKFNIWLDMTKALLLNNQSKIKTFNVLMFNIESFWWKETPVSNTPANVQAFLNYASNLALEGASDIGQAIQSTNTVAWAKNSSDNVFLMSDGADTWGETDPNLIMKSFDNKDHLFVFNTGLSGTSSDKLNVLGKLGKGALFTITGEAEISKISQAIQYTPWRIKSIKVDGSDDFIVEGDLQYLYPEQTLKITGKGKIRKGGKTKITLSQNGQTREIQVSNSQVLNSELAFRAFGQVATEQLENFAHHSEKMSIAFAKHFGIARKTCALLMLDTEEDYEQYNIQYQEEAYVIKSNNLSHFLSNLKDQVSALLGNAKLKFQASLEKLEKTMGVEFTIPASMEALMSQLPQSSFEVRQKPLTCKVRTVDQIQSAEYDSLKRARLNYDYLNLMAQQRLNNHGKNDALKTLSSLVEKNSGNTVMVRDVAYTAMGWSLYSQAYYLFKRAGNSRPYEPQTYIAMGKCLAAMGNYDLASMMFEIVLNAQWDGRFGEVHRIAGLAYLEVLEDALKSNDYRLKDYGLQRQKGLRESLNIETADLVVVITWNTDNTDIDLHVIEPNGEECFYSNPETKLGGRLTQDVTQGYGPEMYIMKDAKKGKYQVSAHYYSSDRNRASARTKVYATVYENWGTNRQRKREQVLVLEDNKEVHDILTVKL